MSDYGTIEIYAADSTIRDSVNDVINTIMNEPGLAQAFIQMTDGANSVYRVGVQMTEAQKNSFGAAIEEIEGTWFDYFGRTKALRRTLIDSTIYLTSMGEVSPFWEAWRRGLVQSIIYNAPIIAVENFNDNGAGSLREAIDTVGPRKIRNNAGVGYINQESSLLFTDAYWDVDIGGITLRNKPNVANLRPSIGTARGTADNVHDGFLRNLRVRPTLGQGNTNPAKGIEFRSGHHLKLQNLSGSFLSDEIFRLVIDKHPTAAPNDVLHDIEVSYCWFHTIFTKDDHSTGVMLNGQDGQFETPQRTGSLDVYNILFRRNILGPAITHRLPLTGTLQTRVSENLVVGWQSRAIDSVESCDVDLINNLLIAQQESNLNQVFRYQSNEQWKINLNVPDPKFFVSGNKIYTYNGTLLPFDISYYDIVQDETIPSIDVEILYNRKEPLYNIDLWYTDGLLTELPLVAGARDSVTGLDNIDTYFIDNNYLSNPQVYFANDYDEVVEGFTDSWPTL